MFAKLINRFLKGKSHLAAGHWFIVPGQGLVRANRLGGFRTGDVTDDEVCQALRSLPTHFAAPPTTARLNPGGTVLHEGFSANSSVIAFALDPIFNLWEKEITAPKVDGGDAISITTMFNQLVHTTYPQQLIKYDPVKVMGSYNPDCWNRAHDKLINKIGGVTIHIADGSTLSFWGTLQSLEFATWKVGPPQPECTAMIQVNNYDPNNNVEAKPVMTPATGTG